ncbi:MAG: hypothetical protein KGQ37_02140 [Hyphomicrobiales bacterium]|nr:hypothetical protein [Hyphomicrobiales bacterium]
MAARSSESLVQLACGQDELASSLRFMLETDGYKVAAFSTVEAACAAPHDAAALCLVAHLPVACALDRLCPCCAMQRGLAVPLIAILDDPSPPQLTCCLLRHASARLTMPLLGGSLLDAVHACKAEP